MEIGCCVSAGNIEKLPGCGFDFVELPGRNCFRWSPAPSLHYGAGWMNGALGVGA